MGKPPAAIFIVRHGARLDAANKEWHLTSPTPYDPPLSYGGWLQSRALGARIINEVRTLEDQLDRPTPGNHDPIAHSHRLRERKQKRRVIIHTSPFLRCVQTAVAISSGISQNYADIESLRPSRVASTQPSGITPSSDSTTSPGSDTSQGTPRCLLRVDACLGEWLNAEYFENITAPPKSEKMVAAAKMELLRRDESVIPVADTQPTPTVGHFPGGWSGLAPIQIEEEREPEVESSSAVANGSGQRNRAGSYDSFRAVDSPWGRKMLRINTDIPSDPGAAYAPPIPSYAISPSNPIPDGYVTHARDSCVLVDYQWDSMREPQNWGNGGEYGDEWSTMLARFRSGIDRIISWYQDDDASAAPAHRRTRSQLQYLGQNEGEDSAIDTILIIVTHGAGCNALIGALSGEPALVNVPTASLTLAVRKDRMKDVTQDDERAKKYDLLSKTSGPEHYNLVEIASADHLRPGTSPITSSVRSPASLRSPLTSGMPSPPISSYRHRSTISSGPIIMGPSLKAGMGLQSWTTSRPSSGLWKSVVGSRDAVDDLVPNFGSPLSASSSSVSGLDGASDDSSLNSGDSSWSAKLPQRTLSQRGLWRSASLNKERSAHSGRRWTVAERPH
ncbi:uncharacterized protein DSM5745_11180 [Aspergillus mulundensis]|uniref:Phosphoglycerate mutase family protein n=1 Tax=Aspergillus mulundensis TaxID=1810919 RepID=A0A3D8QBY9_9EURO|nr:Uncharacterized protein DSM5745_11180 [Aspergillus mulundensis]RDW58974.1 Uncharacterized protein DSM5745_11180 [Aspergillus mulundensis]